VGSGSAAAAAAPAIPSQAATHEKRARIIIQVGQPSGCRK